MSLFPVGSLIRVLHGDHYGELAFVVEADRSLYARGLTLAYRPTGGGLCHSVPVREDFELMKRCASCDGLGAVPDA